MIEQIVRGTESVHESSDLRICERVAGVCIHFIVYMLYIRRTLSCCICHVFHSVFSVYVHLLYIFLSLFFVDGFYCVVLLNIVLICCCTPDNDVDSPSPDIGRHSWYQSYQVQNLWPGVKQTVYLRVEYNIHAIHS